MQIHAESIFSKQVSHAKKQKKGFYRDMIENRDLCLQRYDKKKQSIVFTALW